MSLKHFSFHIIQLDKVDSTNQYALEQNSDKVYSNGTIIWAKNQYSGKGQKGNRWDSEMGKNLTFSVVCYPKIESRKAFYLNIVASLAVRKTLSDLGIQSEIKWPNDILVHQKKICGILIENQLAGHQIQQSIIGIGLNVNQLKFENGINATSIAVENQAVELEDVLKQCYQYLDFYYNLLIESNFPLLLKHYYSFMFAYKEEVILEDQSGKFTGFLLGVDDFGLLEVLKTNGLKVKYDLKEVKFILNDSK